MLIEEMVGKMWLQNKPWSKKGMKLAPLFILTQSAKVLHGGESKINKTFSTWAIMNISLTLWSTKVVYEYRK